MSVQLTPAKRSYDRSSKGPKGKRKLQKSSTFKSQEILSPGETIFRVLCPTSNTSSVIGIKGSIISQIRKETGAKVKVEEALPGSNERVIIISGSEKDSKISAKEANEVTGEEIKEDTDDVNDTEEVSSEDVKKEDTDEVTANEEGDDEDKDDASDDDEDQKPVPVDVFQSEENKKNSCAQKALLLVFEKMVVGESEKTGGNEESDTSANTMFRLLVFASQVGCILGESGSKIKQMSSDSGAQIQILPKSDVPSSTSTHDEIVQISGEVMVVRNALQAISQLLLENPPNDQDINSHSFGNHHTKPKTYQERGISGPRNPSSDILTFRMLCDDSRIGGVIGRGGNIIKALQFETGCEIKVDERVPGSDDRIIVIYGKVHPDERICAPQIAVLGVQDKIFRAIQNIPENVPAKLLINADQIGVILGKGGNIISDMRKSTGAHIRIQGKDQHLSFASEDVEVVVQVDGEFGAIQEALMQITSRLREHFFRNAFPSAFLNQVPPIPAYGGRRDHLSPGMHTNVGPPFLGLPSSEGFLRPRDDHLPFMNRPGVPPQISGIDPSLMRGPQDNVGVPSRRIGGLGGGIHQPIITNMSMQVVLPRSCADAIYVEDGGCLQQIREFSEAKIDIIDPKPGDTETLIKISGTPEQTYAAQSLIQAFVMLEKGTS